MTKVITKSEHCNLKFLPNSSACGEGLRNCACIERISAIPQAEYFLFSLVYAMIIVIGEDYYDKFFIKTIR